MQFDRDLMSRFCKAVGKELILMYEEENNNAMILEVNTWVDYSDEKIMNSPSNSFVYEMCIRDARNKFGIIKLREAITRVRR